MNKKSDFWELSVATYSRPGVADACLSLQDRHSLDVNLVLFCCWYGSTRGLLNKDIFERVIVFSESWATHVVRPLRNIRTWMKHPDSVEVWQLNKSHLNLRNAIKKSELSAERIQQDTLEEIVSIKPINLKPQEQKINSIKNLRLYLEHYNIKLDDPSLEKLAHVVTSFVSGIDNKSTFKIIKTIFNKI